MENATKSRGVTLRFYEALSPRDIKDELGEAWRTLAKKVGPQNGWLEQDIFIPSVASADLSGAIELLVDYGETEIPYPYDAYVTYVIGAVRNVVGYRIPIVFTFIRPGNTEPMFGYCQVAVIWEVGPLGFLS